MMTMLTPFEKVLLILICASALFDWIVVFFGWRRRKYVSKPLVIVLLILWFGLLGGMQSAPLFALGLVLSLAGDMFLLFPQRYFVFGLLSFLMAHFFYIINFNSGSPDFLVLLVGVVFAFGYTIFIHNFLKPHFVQRPRFLMPVTIYNFFLSLMLVSVVSSFFRADWMFPNALICSIGGLLFFASDTILALDRFVKPFKRGKLIVRITYHLGQILLTVGMVMHLSSSVNLQGV